MDELALYRAILAAPHDDTARLVYADWLDESADARPEPAAGVARARAELIRLQCQIARRTPAGWKRVRDAVPPELARRQKRLLLQHGRKWRRELPVSLASAPFDRGFLRPVRAMRPPEFLLDPGTAPPVRGWPPGALADPLAVPPLWDVHLFGSDYAWDPWADRGQYVMDLLRCATCPNLARVGWLKVSFFRTSTLDFFHLGRFDNVETLVLNCGPFPEVLDAVAANDSFRSLRYVELGGDEHGWCRTWAARERCAELRRKLGEMNALHLPFGEARGALRVVLRGPPIPPQPVLLPALPPRPPQGFRRDTPNMTNVSWLPGAFGFMLLYAIVYVCMGMILRKRSPEPGPPAPPPAVQSQLQPGFDDGATKGQSPAARKPVTPNFVGPLRSGDRWE